MGDVATISAPAWALALPAVNASLNSLATVLLVAAVVAIKAGNKERHRRLMLAAFTTSVVFLAVYLVYHAQVGSVPFTAQGWPRAIYFPILISHVVLAAVVPPMALRTLWLAHKERFEEHRRLARVTFPVWLYVSVTGVLVYLFLYVVWPSAALPR